MEEKDLDFLREQLSQLDEPELPPSLTAKALFARLDEGTLTLPEEEPAPSKEQDKAAVIPWAWLARRWAPLAACLAVVLLLHQGYRVGMARNFSANSATPTASSAEAADAAVPEAAAFHLEDEEAVPEGETEDKAVLRSSDSAGQAAAEDARQKLMNAPTSGAATPPVPEPEAAGDKSQPSYGSSGDSSDRDDSLPENSERPNPPTGGGPNPDSGNVEPVRPPDFDRDSGGENAYYYKLIREQMDVLAAQNAPNEGLCPRIATITVSDDDQLVFKVVYTDDSGVVYSRAEFHCLYFEGKGEAWLELVSFEEKEP